MSEIVDIILQGKNNWEWCQPVLHPFSNCTYIITVDSKTRVIHVFPIVPDCFELIYEEIKNIIYVNRGNKKVSDEQIHFGLSMLPVFGI